MRGYQWLLGLFFSLISTGNADDAVPVGTNHREGFQAEILQYTHQGSGFFPMSVVRALKDKDTGKPYLENLERFGLLPGAKSDRNKEGFPVGIVTNRVKVGNNVEVEMFGFACAACHTSDLRYQGKTIRVDGASGLFSVDLLGDQIANSLEATLKDPEEFFAFLVRFHKFSKPNSLLIAKFEKLIHLKKDSELGEALSTHLHEVAEGLLKEIHGAEQAAAPAANTLKAKAADLLKKKRLGGKLFHDLTEEALKAEFGDIDNALIDIKYRLNFLKSRAWLQKPGHREPAGFGRADDFGTARVELFGGWNKENLRPVNAPVSVPPLWDIDRFAWLHWNSNTNSVIQRSIGEAIGVGATFQLQPVVQTSVDIVNQMHIEEQIQKLTAPVWPDEFGKPNAEKVARGQKVYMQHCAKCHDPTEEDDKGLLLFHLSTVEEAGTDPNDAHNFDQPVFKADGSQVGFAESIAELLQVLQDGARKTMTPADIALMDRLEAKRKPKWRDTEKATGGPVYPARPLDGIWATAPYLHNGAVPTLWHLLLPEDQRPKMFLVGSQDFDPNDVGFEWDPVKNPAKVDPHNPAKKLFELDTTRSGNSNRGHNYGTTMSDGDRRDLIEYLKVHRTPSLQPRQAKAAASGDLLKAQDERHSQYLKDNAEGYDWFANAGDGYGGLPVILLRSLPDLAPEIWGTPEEKFSRFGLMPSPTEAARPFPLGLSWDSMVAGKDSAPFRTAGLTCGACHIGRVQVSADGAPAAYKTIVGGPNTAFDVRLWRNSFERTVHTHLDTPEKIAATAEKWRKIISQKPKNYFYANYRNLPDEVEQKERDLLCFVDAANHKDVARDVLTGFATSILLGEVAVNKQKATSYGAPNAPPLDGGSPGQSDGSGDLIPRLLLLDFVTANGPAATFQNFPTTQFSALPDHVATVTDILSTWKQGKRHVAQIDGSVKSPFYRNIAASLAVAGDPKQVNVPNAEITTGFIRDLPPPAYPFPIDGPKAERGKRLFEDNCLACHRDFNGNLYKARNDIVASQIGTDPNRSRVLNKDALQLFLTHFVASVPADFETKDENGKTYKPHDLPANDIVFDRTEFANQGYVTDSLEGVWARAPYLHNGSVPTLYHLLVPSSRPAKFVRGVESYDRNFVGFSWQIDKLEMLRKSNPTAAPFDTSWDSSSSKGHDKNLTIDATGWIVRPNWDGALNPGEFRVRLDWSDPSQAEALGDLLEYLKSR